MDLPTIQTALRDKNPKVRATALRVSETFFDAEEKTEFLEKLFPLAADSATDVQLQLALTLGQARDKKADVVMANLAKSPITNLFLADAILSGAGGRELELLEKIAGDSSEEISNNFARVLSGLASCVVIERRGERINHLLELIASLKSIARQQILLDGIFSTSAVTAKKPVKLRSEPAAFVALQKNSSSEIRSRAKKISALLTWPGKPGAKPEPIIPPLSAEETKRFESGKILFVGSCAACHQVHGMGMDGLAPPLVDSEWVLGSEERLVRIVLNGLTGPMRVKEQSWHLDMPALGIFDDEQIAAILTYIRREWENGGAPVRPETVKKIRAENSKRQEAWSAPELLLIP